MIHKWDKISDILYICSGCKIIRLHRPTRYEYSHYGFYKIEDNKITDHTELTRYHENNCLSCAIDMQRTHSSDHYIKCHIFDEEYEEDSYEDEMNRMMNIDHA